MASPDTCENTNATDNNGAVATIDPPSVQDRQELVERERNSSNCTTAGALPQVELFHNMNAPETVAQGNGIQRPGDDPPQPGDDPPGPVDGTPPPGNDGSEHQSTTGDGREPPRGVQKGALARYEEDFGVQGETVQDADGNKTYKFYVEGENGKRIEIASANDLSEIDEKLTEWRDNKVKELEQKFGINISADGEVSPNKGDKLRAPMLDELVALESALYHSQPSQLTNGEDPLMINFHADDTQNRGFFSPSYRTIDIYRLKDDHETYADRFQTFEHELAHNGQQNFDSYARAGAMGWRQTEDGSGWIAEGKDGHFYRRDMREEYAEDNLWVRVDANGQPLEPDGTPTHLTNKEMRENMQVRPDSLYFTSPHEMMAEATSHFRNSRDEREDLYRNDPTLYELTKQADQEEINNAYGTAPDGTPKYIRNPDGMLVTNTPEERQLLAEYERDIAEGKNASTGSGSKEREHIETSRSRKYEQTQPPSMYDDPRAGRPR